MATHFWKVRKAKGVVTSGLNGLGDGEKSVMVSTRPNLLLRETVAALVLIAFVLTLAVLFDAPLDKMANSGLSPNPAKTYLKLFSQRPNTDTIAGAEGIALILNAMNRCKTQINRDEINAQIRKTDKFKGFIGRVSIGSDGKPRRPLIVNTINEGELKFLVRVH